MFAASPAPTIRLLARASARSTVRIPISRGLTNFSLARNARPRFAAGRLVFGTALLASFALATNHVYSDAQTESSDVVSTCGTISSVGLVNADFLGADSSTSITFPKTMHISSRVPIPDLNLIGVGVRTVSFLGIKVYSVAFYADLNNPALQVGSCLPSQFTPHRPMDRYHSQPPPKRRSTTLSKTRRVPSRLFLREVHHIVTSATAS